MIASDYYLAALPMPKLSGGIPPLPPAPPSAPPAPAPATLRLLCSPLCGHSPPGCRRLLPGCCCLCLRPLAASCCASRPSKSGPVAQHVRRRFSWGQEPPAACWACCAEPPLLPAGLLRLAAGRAPARVVQQGCDIQLMPLSYFRPFDGPCVVCGRKQLRFWPRGRLPGVHPCNWAVMQQRPHQRPIPRCCGGAAS